MVLRLVLGMTTNAWRVRKFVAVVNIGAADSCRRGLGEFAPARRSRPPTVLAVDPAALPSAASAIAFALNLRHPPASLLQCGAILPQSFAALESLF